MGLITTVIVTSTSFVDKYQSDQVEPYKEFINFLSEESALTKKTLAWFIGEDTQSIYMLKKNSWHLQNFDSSLYPDISDKVLFIDSRGQKLILSKKVEKPFLIFITPSFKTFLRPPNLLFLSKVIGFMQATAHPKKGI